MSAEVMVENLVKRYGPVTAVAGVNLVVLTGEIFGLLGPNGAGKTTTIECILGLRKPDSGTITIAGIDALAHPEPVKQIVGAQLQATALQDKLTPREALKFFGAFYRNSIKPSELLSRFFLTEKADAPFDSLSAGQKQRLALALAFVNNPQLIFLDEPTAGLDAQARRDLHGDIRNLKAAGKTIVLSTHYIEEAHQLCDRIAIINGGQIIAQGTPEELISSNSLSDELHIRTAPPLEEQSLRQLPGVVDLKSADDVWQICTSDKTQTTIALAKLIDSTGAKLLDLQLCRQTLEDAYLERIRMTKFE